MVNIQNGIITMNRGDTFYMPLCINVGTKLEPTYYTITANDEVFFALEEYNQPFEFALIRKKFTESDLVDGNVVIKLNSSDTEKLLPGDYYYEIKLRHVSLDENDLEQEFIDTIVPRRKFIILE